MERLKNVVEAKLAGANAELLKPIKFPAIEDMVEMVWLKLMKRKEPDTEINIGKYQLLTRLGILFLKQNFMQKRIDGAKAIDMVCKRALTSGTVALKDTVKKTSTATDVVPALVQTLKEADIIDLYFGRTNIHDQLVMRSNGMLGLFLNQDALSEEQLTMIWTNCEAAQCYNNLIDALSDMSSNVKPLQLTSIIERVCLIPKNKCKADEIDLLHKLSYEVSGYDTEEEPVVRLNQSKVLEFYWDFLTGEGADEYLSKIVSNKAIFNFMDILKAISQDVVDLYFEKIVQVIRNGSSSFLALKIGHRFFKEKKVNAQAELLNFAEKLEKKYSFLQLIIQELNTYSEIVNVKVREDMAAAQAKEQAFDDSKLHDKIYQSVFDHKEQIEERMEFLTLFTQEVTTKLSKDQLAQLWVVLVDNNMIKFDKKQLFQMLKKFVDEILISEENKVITLEDLSSFYRETLANSNSDYTTLELEGFICIQAFFVLINSREGRIKILNDGAKSSDKPKSILKNAAQPTTDGKITSISSDGGAKQQKLDFTTDTTQISTTGTSTVETGNSAITGGVGTSATAPTCAKPPTSPLSDKEGKLNLMMQAPPSEMEGMTGLWRIAAQVENGKVSEAVVALLIQIHTNLDPSLEGRLSEFENLFINSCIDTIQVNLAIIRARSEEEKLAVQKAVSMADKRKLQVNEKRISLTLKSCLTQLIKKSETEGTYGLCSHRSFAQGTLIQKIEITNEFNYAANKGIQKNFTLTLKSNMNMYQVKKMICKELAFNKITDVQGVPPHPSAIKLVKNAYTDRPILDSENGLLVQEIFLKSNDKFTVSLRGNADILKVSLLDGETEKLTQRIEEAVKSLFDRFAISKPEAPELLFLGTEEIKALMEAVSDKASLRPKDIMAYNTNEDLSIMLYDDFLNYYQTMAKEKPDMVRANLSYIGLRSDMQAVPNPGDSDHILNRRTSAQQMPRYKISNDPRTFQTLLECLDLDSDTKKDANELILQATTNQRILQDVLELSPNMFQWDSNAQSQSSKEFVYTLSMVEQILYNGSDSDPNEGCYSESLLSAEEQARGEDLKNTWVPRFLKSGGLNKLTQMLEAVLQQLVEGRKAQTITNDQILRLKEILSCGVKILKVFVTATVCGTKKDLNADLFSIKQSSSALSKRLQQGSITAITTNKYLRRADKQEEDLEAKLEEACSSKNASVSFFGIHIPKPKSLAKGNTNTTSTSTSAKEKDQGMFKPEDITEDMIFGNDVVIGVDNNDGAEVATNAENQVDETTQLEQPTLARQASKETKEGEKERIHLFTVTDRNRQIAQQITEAINDESFSELASLDFDRLYNFSLEAASIFMFSLDTDKTFERALIQQAFDIWCACAIIKDQPLKWEREEKNIDDHTKIRNMNDLIREGLISVMPEVRRYWFQSLSLVCENLSQGKLREPYHMIIQELLTHLKTIRDEQMGRISEEFYELLADSCLHQYYIEREMKHQEQEIVPLANSYKDVLVTLVAMLKRHNSFVNNIEKLDQAKALESLLLAIADIFSFLKYCETYDTVLEVLKSENLIEYIFYEVIFFVHDKTQGENRNKAKRTETRKAAYQLLFKMLKYLRPADMVDFLKDMLQPMIEGVPRPNSWSHQPSDRVRRADEQVGIKNLGNVCYMISMLQQFFMIPAFRYSLLKVIDSSAPKIEEYKDRQIDDNMLRQLQTLYGYLDMTERASVDPTEFCFSFKQWDGKPTNTGEQRDAQEFINEFFDKLENHLKDSSQKYLLADTFQGSVVSQKVCKGCNYVTRDIDPFYTQTLYVENLPNVYESLNKQVEGEIIQDFRCSACNKQNDLCKSQIMGKLPNVLIIHLQRIVFDFQTYLNKKLTNKFEYPLILDLSKYGAKQNIVLTEEEKADPKNKELLEMLEYSDEEYVYRLVGVCIHRGQANSGHYWSLIHMKRGDQEPDPQAENSKWDDLANNWREFNDDSVNFSLSKNVQDHGYGGGNMTDQETKIFAQTGGTDWSKSAYMLVYEKKLKREIRQIVKEEDKEEELVQTVNFNKVEREIPSWIEEVVKKDNRAHVADQQVFHPLFFTFASQVLKHCTAELLDQEEDYGPEQKAVFKNMQQSLYETGHKLSFDLLTHFKDLDSMKSICSSVRSVFSWSDPIETFGKDPENPSLIVKFIKDVLHEDKCEYLFKVMYDSTALKDVRDQCGRTVARVLIKALKIIGICREDPERKDLPIVAELATLVHETLRNLFGVLVQRTFQSKWSKLGEYFEMLSDIGIDERHQAHFLLTEMQKDGEDDIVTRLCDFMLQQDSPKALDEPDPRVEMGGNHNKPVFGPLVSLASHLVRCQWTKTSIADGPSFAKRYQKDKKATPQNMLDTRIDLPDTALEYFTNSDLFDLIMTNDYGVICYAKALAHLCYGNETLSKKVCKMARTSCFASDHPNYLIVLRHLLKLDDKDAETGESLQPKRLEWVFGTPQLRYGQNAASGVVQVGLSHLGYNINNESYHYVTSICENEDDQKSVLSILLASYCAPSMAYDQAIVQISPKGDSSKDEEQIETNVAAAKGGEIQHSDSLDQLRAQGMPEDEIRQMATMLGRDYEAPDKKTVKRSKSDTDVASTNKTSKSAAVGVHVDQNTNLVPLEEFMRIVANDDVTMGYFAKIPGFTYQYARYTDWIGQYLRAITVIDDKDSKALDKNQKSSLKALKVLYARFEEFLTHGPTLIEEQKSQEQAEDVQMIDTVNRDASPCPVNSPPMPYMPLKTESDVDSGVTIESNGLLLSSLSLKCTYVDSRPDNTTNQAVAQSFLSRFGTNKPKAQKASTKPSNSSSTQPAGDQDQAVPDNVSTEAQGAKYEEQGGNGDTSGAQGQYTEPATMEDLTIDTEDPAIQYALQQLLTDPEFMWVFELPEDDKLQALENICKDTVYGHVKDYYQVNAVVVSSSAAPVTSAAVQAQPASAASAEEEKKQEEANVDDPFTVWEGDEIKTCDDLVYVLRLTNTTGESMKFSLNFKEGMADSTANLVWPREGLTGSIAANEVNKIVAVLPKLTACEREGPLSEIQKLQVTLEGRSDSKANAGAGEVAGASNNVNKNGGTNESKHDVSVGNGAVFDASEKSCEICTMINPVAATECHMCYTKFQN